MNILDNFKHLFLPHHTNNHRAKILHPKGITFLTAIVIFAEMALIGVAKVRPDILGYATDISVERLYQETNNKRTERGISPLNLDSQLSQAAAGKAQDMFSNNYWAHVSPTGKTPWDFIISAGYSYVYAGENLAKDFQDSVSVVNAWMDSPTHRENILQEKYQDVGFAVVNGVLAGEETTLVVQMFGTRSPQSYQTTKNLPTVVPEKVNEITNVISALPENATPTQMPVEIIKSTPTPIIPLAVISKTPPKTPEIIAYEDVVVNKRPKFDLYALSQNMVTSLILILMGLLIADSVMISKKRIIRLTGDNLAHLLILTVLLGTMYIIGRGSIL